MKNFKLTKAEENLIDYANQLKLISRFRRELHRMFEFDDVENNRDYREATESLNEYEIYVWSKIEGDGKLNEEKKDE